MKKSAQDGLNPVKSPYRKNLEERASRPMGNSDIAKAKKQLSDLDVDLEVRRESRDTGSISPYRESLQRTARAGERARQGRVIQSSATRASNIRAGEEARRQIAAIREARVKNRK